MSKHSIGAARSWRFSTMPRARAYSGVVAGSKAVENARGDRDDVFTAPAKLDSEQITAQYTRSPGGRKSDLDLFGEERIVAGCNHRREDTGQVLDAIVGPEAADRSGLAVRGVPVRGRSGGARPR